jgi:hypothetical protein
VWSEQSCYNTSLRHIWGNTCRTFYASTSGGRIVSDSSLTHNAVPGTLGFILGGVFQVLALPYLNPMQWTFIAAIILSPGIAKLTKTKLGLDHSAGMAAILIPFALLWLLGVSYIVIAIPALTWIWMSMSWQNLELPPFRIGFWHGTGISFTAFVGVIVAFQLVQ